jgi:hypothetical protein
MNEKRAYASLLVKSDVVQVDLIGEMLTPLIGRIQLKDAPISSRSNASLASHSSWTLSTKNSSECPSENSPISEHIQWIIERIEGRRKELSQLAANCDIEISCFLSTESTNCWFDIPHAMVKKLAEYKIDLVFDVYAS